MTAKYVMNKKNRWIINKRMIEWINQWMKMLKKGRLTAKVSVQKKVMTKDFTDKKWSNERKINMAG